jgi:hypothetical protein
LDADDEVEGAGPPDFVGGEYQRRAGEDVRGVFCGDWVIRVTRTRAEMLVLAQIAYWFAETKGGKLKVTIQRNGRWWVYKTYRQLAKDLRGLVTADAARGAIRSLEQRGVLLSDYDGARSPPKLYRINPVAIERLVAAADLASSRRRPKRCLADDEE